MVCEEDVIRALDRVRDPELDQALPELGFVSGIEIDRGRVRVSLRLPTFFCAPNFAFLMVADTREALLGLPGVEVAEVSLDDHFASEEINSTVSRGAGFAEAFPGETEGDLDSLRDLFRRKALVARQATVAEELRRHGRDDEQLAALTVADLPGSPDAERALELRVELGLPVASDSPALVRPDGTGLDGEQLGRWLRSARLVRISLEGNGNLCRGLLQTRYEIPDSKEAHAV